MTSRDEARRYWLGVAKVALIGVLLFFGGMSIAYGVMSTLP